MPINIHTDEMKAWKLVQVHINRLIRNNTSMDYDQLVLNVISTHPVGERQVDNHIKRYYLDKGIVHLEENKITPPGGQTT